ncbi:hypothetical protein RQM47_03695 [Rubrivirga sp. S365]|uniref:YncE family protein n=1 Tax=Rubrivirga sp. S365 TaxID=3076080 RepID=UPI0028C7F037|nr:hypothetical protein [Rubrivirga sp. S365]MDT7855737.1 hypothetical protein [Rubrivirga sp. S365]
MPRLSVLRPALLLVLALAVAACDANDPDEVEAGTVLFVGNQGNFSDNNGSVTRYDVATGTVTPDAVPTVDGLVQGLVGGGDALYVLLNYSDSFTTGRGRIDVYDAASRTTTAQYDVRTPRGLANGPSLTGGGPLDLYVTNLYDGTVTLLDLGTGETGAPVEVGPNPEGVVSVNGRTYVANSGFGSGTSVSVLDTETGRVVDTLDDLCVGPRTLLADADLDVWVVCTGATDFETGEVAGGAVVVLDGATGAVRTRFDYDTTLGSATLGADGAVPSNTTAREVYVIGSGAVLRFDATDNTLDARVEVPGAPVGAVAYDADGERLYLGRPDAVSPYGADGVVTVHDRAGAEVGRFGAGIAPSALAFGRAAVVAEG